MAHSKLAERGKKKPMISHAAVAPLLMIGEEKRPYISRLSWNWICDNHEKNPKIAIIGSAVNVSLSIIIG